MGVYMRSTARVVPRAIVIGLLTQWRISYLSVVVIPGVGDPSVRSYRRGRPANPKGSRALRVSNLSMPQAFCLPPLFHKQAFQESLTPLIKSGRILKAWA